MDYVRSITFCLLSLLALSARGETISATPVSAIAQQQGYQVTDGATMIVPATAGHTSVAAACADPLVKSYLDSSSAGYAPHTYFGAGVSYCQYYATIGGNQSGPWNYFQSGAVWYCPAGYTLSGGQCSPDVAYSCPSGQNWTLSGSSCTRPDCVAGEVRNEGTGLCQADCVAGRIVSGTIPVAQSPAYVCASGCDTLPVSVSDQYQSSGSQVWYGQWEMTGAQCSGGGALGIGGAPASGPCGAGLCWGEFNGALTCVACGATAPKREVATKTSTSTDAQGVTTTQRQVTTTTDSGDSVKRETLTSTSVGGAPAEEETKTEESPKDSFCEQNPSAPLCKESAFGGACGAFTCEGDAVQCAMAREQYTRNCALFESASAQSELGNAAMAGTDDGSINNPASAGNRESVALGPITPGAEPFAAACLPSLDFSVAGQSLEVPFPSSICDVFAVMGNIFVGLCALVGLGIVGKGI